MCLLAPTVSDRFSCTSRDFLEALQPMLLNGRPTSSMSSIPTTPPKPFKMSTPRTSIGGTEIGGDHIGRITRRRLRRLSIFPHGFVLRHTDPLLAMRQQWPMGRAHDASPSYPTALCPLYARMAGGTVMYWGSISATGACRASFFLPSRTRACFCPPSPNNLECLRAVSKTENLARPLQPVYDDGKGGGWKWWE